ncbi:unnamed protein product, partial [Pylaiella littoralis]
YNKQCAVCNLTETRSRQRLKLCEDNPDYRRWVHKSRAHEVSLGPGVKRVCCTHRASEKNTCCCYK